MAAESEEYLAVLKASYDYEPQSEDEIAMKEGQMLFLKEKVDEDWWKVKIKGESQEEDSPVGLVPAAYVESADHTSVVKALYDYEANAPGELSVKEDEILFVYDTEDDWLLVQSQSEGGKAGFVPGNYVEATSEEEEEAQHAAPAPAIIIPPSAPRPVSTYVDPADRVASSKANADDIKTWAISEIDAKGKKKKGTLGIGNGAVFFASESDKTPVQKWQTLDIESTSIEKTKHVHINVAGPNPINLHFNAGSKDTAEAIVAKLQSSKELSKSSSTSTSASPPPEDRSSTSTEVDPPPPQRALALNLNNKTKKPGATVHFSPSSPAIIPPRESVDMPEEEEEEEETDEPQTNGHVESSEETATALYDFEADGEDELSVAQGELLVVLEKDGDEWWKCRNTKGSIGVVPASYLETVSPGTGARAAAVPKAAAPDEDDEDSEEAREAERLVEAERVEQEKAEKEQREREKKKLEAQQRAKAAAAAAEIERKKRKDASAAAAARSSSPVAKAPAGRTSSSIDSKRPTSNGEPSGSSRPSGEINRPPPEKTRVWHDISGHFRVEAAFLGFNNGKLRLHKVNGVIVEVPAEKMSPEDMHYIEKLTTKKKPTTRLSDDDVPLAISRPGAHVNPAAVPPPKKKGPQVDWFDFFLSAGCDLDDCTRYASSFERDKIDESILPDITDSTMRSLGLREGDIIRVTKAIQNRKPLVKTPGGVSQEQLLRDEELARQLQAEENAGGSPKKRNNTTSPAPNLFAGPGGALKNQPRRGRPQPSKSLPPASVDLSAISTASDNILRTSSPQAASPGLISTSSPPVQPPARSSSVISPPPPAISGFDDDAWTPRPSSTRPIAPSPPVTAPRAPSAPPPTTVPLPAQSTPAPAPPAPPAPAAPAPAQNSGVGLAHTTESNIFEQLSRMADLRKNTPISPAPPVSMSPAITATPPIGYQSGMGMGSSPVPMGQHLQAQQTGMLPPAQQTYNGPRGPFAPVPANQSLLQPLIPTQTGFNSFIPTRPSNTTSPFPGQNQSPFLNPQPTGYQQPQPTGFQPSQPSFMSSQPTGFQPSQPSGYMTSQPTGYQPSQPMMSQPIMSQPTGSSFGSFGSPFQNPGFGQVQSNPTGFNPGFGQSPFGGMSSPPPVPPLPQTNNTNPANVFASMKSGTFASDNGQNPQPAANYDALRPNPLVAQSTGWVGQYNGYQGYQR